MTSCSGARDPSVKEVGDRVAVGAAVDEGEDGIGGDMGDWARSIEKSSKKRKDIYVKRRFLNSYIERDGFRQHWPTEVLCPRNADKPDLDNSEPKGPYRMLMIVSTLRRPHWLETRACLAAVPQPIHKSCSKSLRIDWPNSRVLLFEGKHKRLLLMLVRHTSMTSACLISSSDHVLPIAKAPFWLRFVLYSRILLRFSNSRICTLFSVKQLEIPYRKAYLKLTS